MRGLIYTLSLHGVGHVKRMLFLAEELVRESEVTFLQAGEDLEITYQHPRLQHVILESQRSNPNWDLRREQIKSVIKPFDFVIIEQIPFTKLRWFEEVMELINLVKEQNSQAVFICSHKGAMPEKSASSKNTQKKMLSLIKKHFNAVFVHSDPKLICLDDSFYFVDEIADRVHYTGFISKLGHPYKQLQSREKTIVVSNGGGDKGLKLLQAAVLVMPSFRDYTFKFITGPMMSHETRSQLQHVKTTHENMEIIDFVEDFEQQLLQSSLLITLAGFTLVSAYATGIPTISFPAPNSGNQHIVAKAFGKVSSIHAIKEEFLNPTILQSIIQKLLDKPPKPDLEINIDGAAQSLQKIKRMIQNQ